MVPAKLITGLRALAFTALVPGTVVGLIPQWLTELCPEKFETGLFRPAGLVLLAGGLVLYLASALSFLIKGGGTPAIWFTKPLNFLIGEEPAKFVSSGLYRISRNPMYLGVIAVVLGEGVWFESIVLLKYAVVLWVFFHLVVIYIEEPHLKRKDGAAYEQYCRTAPRWIGFRPGSKSITPQLPR